MQLYLFIVNHDGYFIKNYSCALPSFYMKMGQTFKEMDWTP